MLDTYNPPYSEAEGKAVAQLMSAAGVSVDMAYGPYVSGAMTQQAAEALVTYFDYDKGITVLYRDLYGIEEWGEVLYNQLDKYGPVVYAGANNNGGHAFVCDGYSRDGYFHFNWGWSGISDGYYLLTALNPPSQGIGGSSGAFSYEQDIIANVRPAQPDSHYILNLIMHDNFMVSQESVPVGGTVTIKSINFDQLIWNYSAYPFTGLCGIRITPCDGTEGETVYSGSQLPAGIGIIEYIPSYECTIPDNLPDGIYRVTPVGKDPDGDWQDIHVVNNYVKELTMTVKDGVCTFQPVRPSYLSASDITFVSEIYLGNKFGFTATLSNPSDEEYHGYICPVLMNDENEILAAGEFHVVELSPGESSTLDYIGSFNQLIGDVTEGTYNFGIVGLLTEELYSIPVPVTVHKEPETTTLSNPTEVITPGNDPDHLPAGDVEIATEVTCEEGYYGSPLIFYLYGPEYYDGSPMLNSVLTSNTLYLKSGEKGTASVTVNLKGSKEGTWYGGLFYDRNYATLTKWKSFMVYDDESSIDTTGSDTIGLEVEGDAATVTGAASADVEIFSAEGVRALYARATSGVSLASLPHGIYIVVITTPDGHRAVRKIIR